jgi:hypothetical protein
MAKRGPKLKVPYVEMATVERDVRDGRRDYKIPREEAQRLYKEGKLEIDLTNSINEIVYMEPERK